MGAEIRTFRDLVAWQKTMDLVQLMYAHTDSMPREGQFGLTSQIRRAASSIPLNIAEGYGRGTTAEFLRSLRNARGSWRELSTAVEIAVRVKLLTPEQVRLGMMGEAERVLQGLIRSLESKIARDPKVADAPLFPKRQPPTEH